MRCAAIVGLAFLVLAAPAFAEAVETSPEAGSSQDKLAKQAKPHASHKARTKAKASTSHHKPSTGSGKPVQPGGNGGSDTGGSPSGPG